MQPSEKLEAEKGKTLRLTESDRERERRKWLRDCRVGSPDVPRKWDTHDQMESNKQTTKKLYNLIFISIIKSIYSSFKFIGTPRRAAFLSFMCVRFWVSVNMRLICRAIRTTETLLTIILDVYTRRNWFSCICRVALAERKYIQYVWNGFAASGTVIGIWNKFTSL